MNEGNHSLHCRLPYSIPGTVIYKMEDTSRFLDDKSQGEKIEKEKPLFFSAELHTTSVFVMLFF
jgi:hypothetical protein